MSGSQDDSLFTELTDRESAAVSGASLNSGSGVFRGSSSKTYGAKDSEPNPKLLFWVPNSGQFYIYDPNRARPYKTIVV